MGKCVGKCMCHTVMLDASLRSSPMNYPWCTIFLDGAVTAPKDKEERYCLAWWHTLFPRSAGATVQPSTGSFCTGQYTYTTEKQILGRPRCCNAAQGHTACPVYRGGMLSDLERPPVNELQGGAVRVHGTLSRQSSFLTCHLRSRYPVVQ